MPGCRCRDPPRAQTARQVGGDGPVPCQAPKRSLGKVWGTPRWGQSWPVRLLGALGALAQLLLLRKEDSDTKSLLRARWEQTCTSLLPVADGFLHCHVFSHHISWKQSSSNNSHVASLQKPSLAFSLIGEARCTCSSLLTHFMADWLTWEAECNPEKAFGCLRLCWSCGWACTLHFAPKFVILEPNSFHPCSGVACIIQASKIFPSHS